jgi:hypothetical protein
MFSGFVDDSTAGATFQDSAKNIITSRLRGRKEISQAFAEVIRFRTSFTDFWFKRSFTIAYPQLSNHGACFLMKINFFRENEWQNPFWT